MYLVYAARVKKQEAQEKIATLKEKDIYDSSRRVLRDKNFVYVPVKIKIKGAVKKELKNSGRKKSLKDLFGIGSFDIIGDAIIIWIPKELENKEKEIGKQALKLYPNVKAVYKKDSAVSGEYRIPKLKLIAGKQTVATHLENGLKFKLDVTKAYFSPRQSGERQKLTKYVKKGDEVCVLFAGIGPIPVYFSKLTNAKKIVAVEINPSAASFMRENLKLNKCENVVSICSDVKDVYRSLGKFDLLVLPLPKSSVKYSKIALEMLKQGGRAIFYIASSKENLENKISKLQGFVVEKIRKEIEISPNEYRFVVHVRRD